MQGAMTENKSFKSEYDDFLLTVSVGFDEVSEMTNILVIKLKY